MEAHMADGGDTAQTRQSSPRFPFIGLTKAIQRAEQLREAAGANFVPMEQLREIWGYAPKSSGGDQTVAALGYYGLLEETGSGDGRRLKLSDMAVRYLRDERPEVRQQLAGQMALAPKVMQNLWNLWGWEPPTNPAVARSILKNDLNFSDTAAAQVLDVYRANLQFFPGATSAKPLGTKGNQEEPDGKNPPRDPPTVKVGDWIQWTSKGVNQFSEPRKVSWIDAAKGFLRVEGSMTGIPISEVTEARPPAAPTGQAFALKPPPPGELQVLLAGQRLQITADVDLDGLKRLQAMLAKYEEILQMMKPN
jgi:hypothetical protein